MDKERGTTVPGGESSSCMGDSKPAVGEGRPVGFANEESICWEGFLEGLDGRVRGPLEVHKRVVFEAGHTAADSTAPATEREEPMGEGGGPQLSSPLEDGIGEHLLVSWTGGSPTLQAFLEALVHISGHGRRHGPIVVDVGLSLRQHVSRCATSSHELARAVGKDRPATFLVHGGRGLAGVRLLARQQVKSDQVKSTVPSKNKVGLSVRQSEQTYTA
mmetsp:Transcript_94710/g.197884  ORF Transcript_94710/g.197884 Transcript_94710/m.197884 type:complete len:217 (-) Transcript_94710:8-658(-)